MDKVLHFPRLNGVVRAPSSKSEAHRALIVAALAGEGLLWCNEYVRARANPLMQNLEFTPLMKRILILKANM